MYVVPEGEGSRSSKKRERPELFFSTTTEWRACFEKISTEKVLRNFLKKTSRLTILPEINFTVQQCWACAHIRALFTASPFFVRELPDAQSLRETHEYDDDDQEVMEHNMADLMLIESTSK